jgi:hypothetical protein
MPPPITCTLHAQMPTKHAIASSNGRIITHGPAGGPGRPRWLPKGPLWLLIDASQRVNAIGMHGWHPFYGFLIAGNCSVPGTPPAARHN